MTSPPEEPSGSPSTRHLLVPLNRPSPPGRSVERAEHPIAKRVKYCTGSPSIQAGERDLFVLRKNGRSRHMSTEQKEQSIQFRALHSGSLPLIGTYENLNREALSGAELKH